MTRTRHARRHRIWFPVKLEAGEQGEAIAMSHDVSTGGLLLATAHELEEGSTVKLRFRMTPEDPEEHVVEGRIVRIETNEADPDGLWPRRMAVEFDSEHEELASAIRELLD